MDNLLTYSLVQSLSWEAKFPAFLGTRRFITTLTSVRHLSLSWASPIQSIYPHPTSWRSILILSTHLRLGLSDGLLPACFPTKTLYTPLSSPIRATCPAYLVLLDFIIRDIYGLHTFSETYVHMLLYVNDWKRVNFSTNLFYHIAALNTKAALCIGFNNITTTLPLYTTVAKPYGSTPLPHASYSTPRWQNYMVQHHYHNPPTLHHGCKTTRFNSITTTLPLYTAVAKPYGSTPLPQPSHSTPRWQNHTVQQHYHNPPTLHHCGKTIRFIVITTTLPLYTTVAKPYGSTPLPQSSRSTTRLQNHAVQHHYHRQARNTIPSHLHPSPFRKTCLPNVQFNVTLPSPSRSFKRIIPERFLLQ